MFPNHIHAQTYNRHIVPRRLSNKHTIHRPTILAMLATLIINVGCSEPRVPVFPVTGKVTYKGQAPVGATVVLHSANAGPTNDVAPIATVKDDGTFAITSYEPGDGAPQGEYVATIEWYKYEPKLGGVGPNVIPANYGRAKTSPVKVAVKDGPTNIPPIQIKEL
jgi:hypothetical protein